MAGIPQQPVQKGKTSLGLWAGIGVILIAVAVVAVIYVVVNRTNSNGNANNAVVQANTTTNGSTNSAGNENTNQPFVDNALTSYRNAAFGYTVKYSSQPGSEPSTWSTSNVDENLYDEWGVGRGTDQVIVIQVYPTNKKSDVFSAKNFEATDDTEALNLNTTANILKVDNEVRGYTFDRGSYTFVLFSGGSVGSSSYSEFKTIAQTLYF
jgi:hypothetical protein